MSDFMYEDGVEEGVEIVGGGKVKNEVIAVVGPHPARIRSIVHCGVTEAFYEGQSKGKTPKAVIVFELKGEGDFETDGETPLALTKDIEIKKGEKANIELLRSAFKKADGTKAANFSELIGCVGSVEVIHSKCGKYANVAAFNKGGVSGLAPMFAKMIPPLEAGLGVGNVKYSEMTVAAVEECHAWNHVEDIMMQADGYEGSQVQKCIEEIRAQEGRENFANREASKKANKSKPTPTDESKATPPPQMVDDGEEY